MRLIQKRITFFTQNVDARGFHSLMRKKILHKVTHFLSWFFFSSVQGSRKTLKKHPHSTPRRARSRHRNAILCRCALCDLLLHDAFCMNAMKTILARFLFLIRSPLLLFRWVESSSGSSSHSSRAVEKPSKNTLIPRRAGLGRATGMRFYVGV